jgi:hypothetical protein
VQGVSARNFLKKNGPLGRPGFSIAPERRILQDLKLPLNISRTIWAHYGRDELTDSKEWPSSGGRLSKIRSRSAYPGTKGSAGGKLPAGKQAVRSPRRSFSAASRKAPKNQE